MAHYLNGETLVEAYWKSVLMPGQGVFVGDPLARPFGGVRATASAAGTAVATRAIPPGDYLLEASRSSIGPFQTIRAVRIVGFGVRHLTLPANDPRYFRVRPVVASERRRFELAFELKDPLLRLDAERDDHSRDHVVRRDRGDQLDQLPIVAERAACRLEGRLGDLHRTRHLDASRRVAWPAASNRAGSPNATSTSRSGSTCASLAPAARNSGAW